MQNDTEIGDSAIQATEPNSGRTGAIKVVWDFFSSMKTAIVLLLVLAATSVAGTIIPQGASSDRMIEEYGDSMYKVIHVLRLDSMYDSSWYVGLLVLVGISLAVCSINRFGATWRRAARPRIAASGTQIQGMQVTDTLSAHGSVEATSAAIETALRSSAYHVLRAQDGDDAVVHAARGRLSIWGPYLTHLSILVIFIGAVAGGKLGFGGVAVIKEGSSADSYYVRQTGEEKPLGFRVDLRDFTIGYDKDHSPTSYRSDLNVSDAGGSVAHQVIDVNHPLTYKGVSFYQSDFGLEDVVLKVTGPSGESKNIRFRIATQDGEGGRQYSITSESGDMAFEQIVIGGKKLTVLAHDFAPDYVGGEQVNATSMPLNPAALIMVNERLPEYKGLDAWAKLGWLEESKPAKYKGFTISMDAVDYTVLQVAKNPGLPVVYTGFGLLLLGVFVSFYVTYKVIRIRVSPSEKGSKVLVGGNTRADASVFDADLECLRNAVK